jgi:OmpA-OmpF porin, OOP family
MIKFTFYCALFVMPLLAIAQPTLNTKSKKAMELYTAADNFRVRGQYKKAIELLEEAISKDKNFTEAYFRLGQTYKSLKQYTKANANFETGLSIIKDEKLKTPFWFELGESYFLTGNYEASSNLLVKYTQAVVPSVQMKQRLEHAKKMIDNAAFATKNQALSVTYKQQPLSDTVNCFATQYFPVLTADQQILIYTRRLGTGNNEDEDIVISQKNEQGRWGVPISISQSINSSFNEGTCTISANGRKLIFTSCVGRDTWGSCDLYESNKIGNEWTAPKNLGTNVNSPDWESQPSLSADGRTLYFVSDRRGGIGRRDLWTSVTDTKGNWTKARNLGKEVNTVYDEISPFIHVNSRTLYFASNGLMGFGGYDIYYCEKDERGKWSEPVNFGAPINNHEDQFSLFISTDGDKAYYSHEEVDEWGKSFSRLFQAVIPDDKKMERASNYVKGIVRDKETREPLKALIELIDIETDTIDALTESDSVSGEYLMVLTEGSRYALYINKEKYLFQSLSFNYQDERSNEPILLDIELEKIKAGSRIVLNNIFFEFDKFELQPISLPELEKVLKFLRDNPTTKIEISGHTDKRGAVAYNLELSKKRAEAVRKYLLEKRITANRIISVGEGSSKPLAPNTTTEGQNMNRRIEFRILNI